MRELKDSSVSSTDWMVGLSPTTPDNTPVESIRFNRCTGYNVTQQLLLWGPPVTYSFVPPTATEPGRVQRKVGVGGTETADVCDHVESFTVRHVSASNLVIVSLTVRVPAPGNANHFIQAECTKQVKLRN
jgi:hypothetical protein